MKRMMMIAVVVISFVPGSAFAGEVHVAHRKNVTLISAPATNQAKCKKSGGVWVVDVNGKGICNRGASKANKRKGELKIRLGPMNK